jgi:hypothetical protein
MRGTKLLLIAGAFLFASTQSAFAYIDPVTASIVLQAVVGAFAGVMVAFRRVREKIFGLFRRKPVDVNKQSEDFKAGD